MTPYSSPASLSGTTGRHYEVTVSLDNQPDGVQLGMTANVEIATADDQACSSKPPVQSLSIDTEGAKHSQQKPGSPSLIEQVPAGHDEKLCRALARDMPHHHWVSRARMIRTQHYPMSGPNRVAQPIKVSAFMRHDTV